MPKLCELSVANRSMSDVLDRSELMGPIVAVHNWWFSSRHTTTSRVTPSGQATLATPPGTIMPRRSFESMTDIFSIPFDRIRSGVDLRDMVESQTCASQHQVAMVVEHIGGCEKPEIHSPTTGPDRLKHPCVSSIEIVAYVVDDCCLPIGGLRFNGLTRVHQTSSSFNIAFWTYLPHPPSVCPQLRKDHHRC